MVGRAIEAAKVARGKAEMATIDDILAAVDADETAALDRLFALLSIPSISAVPAHFADCDRAADWLVAELGAIGFEAAKRPTPGRPWSSVMSRPVGARRRMCCSTAIMTCSRSIP